MVYFKLNLFGGVNFYLFLEFTHNNIETDCLNSFCISCLSPPWDDAHPRWCNGYASSRPARPPVHRPDCTPGTDSQSHASVMELMLTSPTYQVTPCYFVFIVHSVAFSSLRSYSADILIHQKPPCAEESL